MIYFTMKNKYNQRVVYLSEYSDISECKIGEINIVGLKIELFN